MKEVKAKYAVREQDFKSLREGGYIYIDKTEYIQKILDRGQYFFLSRPRRFGKSLFLSTLRYFFEGERRLFKGLTIDHSDWNWEKFPVLYLDLITGRYEDTEQLSGVLDNQLRDWEEKYEIEVRDTDFSLRLKTIIKRAHEKTGKKVVILVDEYDKPLVNNLNKESNFEIYRAQLASLYSNFKSSAEHLRLVLLTGVSRFSKLSVFSDLKNIKDISFSEDFGDICGITEKELDENLHSGIKELAEKADCSLEEAHRQLKENYDGYRFTPNGSELYNPWSLLNSMQDSEIANYWNETGIPTVVAESLKRVDADLKKSVNTICNLEELKGLDLLDPNPVAVMYQPGYLTIKKYLPKIRKVQLGIPNREVKEGFLTALLPYYLNLKSYQANRIVGEISDNFILGDPDKAMKAMQAYFAGIDYSLRIENENNFHNALFLLLDFLGLNTTAEAHTSDGRIDLLVQTTDYIYIIELKYDHSAQSALKQIEDKECALRYSLDPRFIYGIGVCFSSEHRRITDWAIKALKEGERDA